MPEPGSNKVSAPGGLSRFPNVDGRGNHHQDHEVGNAIVHHTVAVSSTQTAFNANRRPRLKPNRRSHKPTGADRETLNRRLNYLGSEWGTDV